ncbi:hypothetical protein C4K39_4905 [Pseudomonas sessilinigenes]|nr:hypothetical protein C4K39_4905 [Pseudomonas sessilinigenes]
MLEQRLPKPALHGGHLIDGARYRISLVKYHYNMPMGPNQRIWYR